MEDVVLKGMEKDPAKRYLRASEMASDLRRLFPDRKPFLRDGGLPFPRWWIAAGFLVVSLGTSWILISGGDRKGP